MTVELIKEYRFEAAHLLPNVPAGHKCARLHGHSFKFEVHVVGSVDARTGWFVDYGDLDAIVMPLVDQLDHHYLNEIAGLENPTSEVCVKWLFDHIKRAFPALVAITFHETCDARCVYRGA
jgi:6-pyruvoyltetrahydropterin/6-carboxytetrahydropterin synthase